MISQTHHIALSILLISLISLNNNESFFYSSATSVTSNTLNTRLRISTNLRINSNTAATKGKDIVSDIDETRRELQEDVVDQREDSIEGQEELFISQNCLNLLAGKLFLLLICVLCFECGMHIAVDGVCIRGVHDGLEIVYVVFAGFMWWCYG